MVNWLFAGSILILSIVTFASDVVIIPRGSAKAYWQSPISQKNKSKIQTIKVNSFKIMSSAVTVGDFKLFIKMNPNWSKDKVSKLYIDESYLEMLFNSKNSDQSPVTSVSWFVAKAYCESVNMRLPTLNEWEYVAQSSESKKDAHKDERFLRRILDWYGEVKGDRLKPVKSIYKNIYGVWDMHGLIWEWVDDFNSNFVTGESREDSSFNKDMFCGAGSLNSADKENYAAFMRFAFRSSLTGKSSVWNLGFRCAEDVIK
jgi:formylglycine-generating enzyme required for sulfatase activity